MKNENPIIRKKISALTLECKVLTREIIYAYLTLLKLMVPALIVVKILDIMGMIDLLGAWLSPVMQLVGLPQELGIVWATAIFTNIYAAMVVFAEVTANLELSVANVSVIGLLVLLSHSVPVEGAVAKMAGVSWRVTIALKVGSGLLLAALVNRLYAEFDYQQGPAQMLWQPQETQISLQGWLIDQVTMLAWIFVILSGLMIVLRILKKLGVELLLQYLLTPLLKVLGMTKNASNITVIGLLLGLSFGAGLLITEIKKGVISRRDVFLSMCFLSLAHSLIEDTVLILLLGSDLIAVLWLRIVFAVLVIFLMARYLARRDSAIVKIA